MILRILNALGIAVLIAYGAVALYLTPAMCRGFDYDATTRQIRPSTCETCKGFNLDEWDDYIAWYMAGCSLCPADGGTAKLLAQR